MRRQKSPAGTDEKKSPRDSDQRPAMSSGPGRWPGQDVRLVVEDRVQARPAAQHFGEQAAVKNPVDHPAGDHVTARTVRCSPAGTAAAAPTLRPADHHVLPAP
ncbi:hypothetical protein ACGF8B_25585 [Streptomyces sp. NPDC047917]|uniref:hypothetical protein n=1 Tax=Streptomyces sp. NPDC047917 TaxID=3365491 RepID=UPI0037211D5C